MIVPSAKSALTLGISVGLGSAATVTPIVQQAAMSSNERLALIVSVATIVSTILSSVFLLGRRYHDWTTSNARLTVLLQEMKLMVQSNTNRVNHLERALIRHQLIDEDGHALHNRRSGDLVE